MECNCRISKKYKAALHHYLHVKAIYGNPHIEHFSN